MEESPVYVQEAAMLHTVRVLREWITGRGQDEFHFVDVRAGGVAAVYQQREWMRVGRCSLVSPAAP